MNMAANLQFMDKQYSDNKKLITFTGFYRQTYNKN